MPQIYDPENIERLYDVTVVTEYSDPEGKLEFLLNHPSPNARWARAIESYARRIMMDAVFHRLNPRAYAEPRVGLLQKAKEAVAGLHPTTTTEREHYAKYVRNIQERIRDLQSEEFLTTGKVPLHIKSKPQTPKEQQEQDEFLAQISLEIERDGFPPPSVPSPELRAIFEKWNKK